MGKVRRALAMTAMMLAVIVVVGGTATGQGGRSLSTALSGEEVSPSGDPTGTGHARLRLTQGQETICFEIRWEDVISDVTSGHIHEAPAGETGDVVVALFSGDFGGTDAVAGCAESVEPDQIKAIRQNPNGYYVQIHSMTHPAGALRGQLTR